MTEDVKKVFDTFGDKLASSKEELIQINGTDYIRDKITDLFQGKIGEPPIKQDELNEIYSEGQKRYEICRPPGFLDKDKDKDKDKNNNCYIYKGLVVKRAYGDLILWKQILKQVKSKPLSHIIFITRDNKDDWWRKEHGKTIGPRPELTEEILDAGASMFYMYTPKRFLEFATKYTPVQVKEESIQQVEEVSVSNSLSEPELRGNFSRQSVIDSYGLSNIANLTKQLSAIDAMQLINIDNYGLRNNISAISDMMAEQDRFIASVNQTIENHNRFMEQMKKQVAIPKQLIPPTINTLPESGERYRSSQKAESSED